MRIAGWILPGVLILALLPLELRGVPLLRSVVDAGLSKLGLGGGIAPLEFFAFSWLVVGLLFWLQASHRGQRLGPKSAVVFGTALATQAVLFVVATAA